MISSHHELKEYLHADMAVNCGPVGRQWKSMFMCRLDRDYNLLYLHILRRNEFVLNCLTGWKKSVLLWFLKRRLHKLSIVTGIYIPPNTFGKGLFIPHWGAIVVNDNARFGDNCVVQNCVNVSGGVVGGNHIYLGAGAKVMLNVHLADDVIVGANAVVTKSIETPNLVVAGVPARIISEKGFRDRRSI